MSDYQRCPLCHDWGWFGAKSYTFGPHVCKPAWECQPEWYSDADDWETVHAGDAESAAEKYAEQYDCTGGEYAIVGNKMRGDVVIRVRKPGDEAFERWDIEAEAVPTYHATKIETAPAVPSTNGDGAAK